MVKIQRERLQDLLARISETATVYAPVTHKNGAKFKKWSPEKELDLTGNTDRSAKDFFFPQVENLAAFQVEGQHITVIDNRVESEDFVVFGVRACDARSFAILDRVFLADPVDSYYKNRRDHGTVISLACTDPGQTCFCQTFGIDATAPEGDIRAYLTEDALVLQSLTEKGEAILSKVSDLTAEADAGEVEAQIQDAKEKLAKLPLANLRAEDLTAKQLETFSSEKWASLSKACLGCGSCTFVCPTCQCYDIQDFDTGNGIQRFRCWDSCMYHDFTMMAHGTPRLTQLERFRQRFMHKLVYYPMNNEGIHGCVGCGRCLNKCPISMNIVKVIHALREVKQ